MLVARQFQSTLSVRRATAVSHGHLRQQNISIHALRKESDVWFLLLLHDESFQSTLSVRRATGTTGKLGEITIKFQSTLSVRRATGRAMALNTMLKISIHALRKESDRV